MYKISLLAVVAAFLLWMLSFAVAYYQLAELARILIYATLASLFIAIIAFLIGLAKNLFDM